MLNLIVAQAVHGVLLVVYVNIQNILRMREREKRNRIAWYNMVAQERGDERWQSE